MGTYQMIIYAIFALAAVSIASTIVLIVWLHRREAKLIEKRKGK